MENIQQEQLRCVNVVCNNIDCPKAAMCIRMSAYMASDISFSKTMVDARFCIASNQYPAFYPVKSAVIARGFKRTLLKVPYGNARRVREEIQSALGCGKTYFYKYVNGEVNIYVSLQHIIAGILGKYGISETDIFDKLYEGYELSEV